VNDGGFQQRRSSRRIEARRQAQPSATANSSPNASATSALKWTAVPTAAADEKRRALSSAIAAGIVSVPRATGSTFEAPTAENAYRDLRRWIDVSDG
jgi:hypothetical protein